ncbi:MAG TPA: DUF4291 domain-containing protein [Candidatus Flavonifractor merdigallinarum]|uniref:DUF4291 domain-containing protein n=1 Tax=Candidatus Flavonifractor merdigallinarum TaxID=2838589 RepID=A0A9D1Y9K9_9FIRM|nr:DUF4291 domain-containing protein [Candidatus Flavonifractor merdigallinarum]
MESIQPQARAIRAVYTDTTIRVYQAFSPLIADEAVQLGTFGPHFKRTRMTWIKPSFLWMMYRCGWAEKEGQERVLAIDLKRSGFDDLVRTAVESTHRAYPNLSLAEWQKLIQTSQVRCQWDPERTPDGSPLPYRSLQLGLRGEAVSHYVDDWIVRLSDITDYVKDLNQKRRSGVDIRPELPPERDYPMPD